MRNVIVGQSGGPTAVINASLAGVYAMAKEKGAGKVYGMRNGIQGLLNESYVVLDETLESKLNLELLKKTPSAYLGSCRYKFPDIEKDRETYVKLFEILDKLEIKAFVYIGGNDSMDTIRKLSDYAAEIGSDIKFVGAPKTIDNDLAQTDHTPGFGSAAKFIAAAMKECIRDEMVYTLRTNIYICEIMGRNAGWLTAASILAKDEDCPGPDLIYLPEVNFDLASFKEKVRALLQKKNSIMIAVSEGIHTSDGVFVCEMGSDGKELDAFGHKQMGGTAAVLADICEKEFNVKTRAIEFNILQRCAAHIASSVDIKEAFESGEVAVAAAMDGKSGYMATLEREENAPYRCSVGLKDIHDIANAERCVPVEWITQDGSYVSDKFIEYAKPLIQGESVPVYIDGVPKHLILK